MRLLLFYSLRNLLARRLTTALTVAGMALVVFVFTAIVMLAAGLEKTLVDTGSADNAVIFRTGSDTEVQSSVERSQAAVIGSYPEIALDAQGRRLAESELVVLMTLPKRSTRSLANVTVRGIGELSAALRPQVRLASGRMPRPGSLEIVVGKAVASGFMGAEPGSLISFAARSWRVVGVLDAGDTGFSSEVWGDREQLMQAFRREAFSSMIFRLKDGSDPAFEAVRARLGADPRLTLAVMRERDFYRKQSEMMATFLRILGLSLTIIFSTGAVVGAMITMFSAVSGRTAEIGTLRALGFGRGTILLAFLLESLALGTAGGVLGILAASGLAFVSVSTVNFQTFSELAFRFALTPAIAAQAMLFAMGMGLLGGALPSIRASRLRIVEALREA